MSQTDHAARLREMAERHKKLATVFRLGEPEESRKHEAFTEALLAGAAALDRTTPEPIGDRHRDGKEWLVWDAEKKGWTLAWWDSFFPAWSGSDGFMFPEGWSPTHALPLPDAPEVAE